MALLVLGAAGTVTMNSASAGTEVVSILAGLDTAGIVRPLAVDSTGRVAIADATDVLDVPSSHTRVALDASGKYVLAANALRTYVEVQNCLSGDIVMKLSATAPTALTDGDILSRGMSFSGFYKGPISFYGNGGAAASNAISIKYWTSA